MATTMFGIIELGKDGDRKPLPNSTFRLHLAGGTRLEDAFLKDAFPNGPAYGFRRDLVLTNKTVVTLHLALRPSTEMIYERELYVSIARDHDSNDVLRLKEGPRFVETSYDGTFMYMLGDFLGQKIPG